MSDIVVFIKNAAFCLAGGLLLLAGTGSGLEAVEPERTKNGVIEHQTLDVGTIEPCVKTNLFRIKNTGDKPLNIRKLIPTCTCVQGFADTMRVEPGGEAVITFELNAALLADAFKRDLWVETDDLRNPRIMLSVTGSVKPLFSGLPPLPVRLVSQEPHAAWTNRYTLVPSEKGLSLGPPQVATNDMLLEVTVETNRHNTAGGYTVTVIAATTQPGKAGARILFPVSNGLSSNLQPAVLTFFSVTGAELQVAPATLLVLDSGEKVSRRVRIRTSDPNVSADKLAWAPQLKGVEVKVEPGRSKSGLNVFLDISQEAVKDLVRRKETRVTFSYPHHDPAVLELVPADSGSASQHASRTDAE